MGSTASTHGYDDDDDGIDWFLDAVGAEEFGRREDDDKGVERMRDESVGDAVRYTRRGTTSDSEEDGRRSLAGGADEVVLDVKEAEEIEDGETVRADNREEEEIIGVVRGETGDDGNVL
jgi:hypothetical protein